MDDILENMKGEWKAGKEHHSVSNTKPEELINLSKNKLKNTNNLHLWNIGILVVTLIGISAFFYYIAQFQEMLSHLGMTLMIGGLIIRILIEALSISKSRRIDMTASAATVNDQFLSFHQYRKSIHGSITVGILVAYTIGFYLLIPEFADYFSTTGTILIAVSYLPAAAIVGYSIRKAIKDEMKLLNELKDIHKGIFGD